MTTIKKSGVWMDHSNAHLMHFSDENTASTSLGSPIAHEAKEERIGKSEHIMHNKEKQLAAAYYKNIGDAIKGYNEVLLFGPTTAKNELANFLKANHHFDKVKVSVENAEKMTGNQMEAFVKEYFSRH